jgi:hypothetical protein
MSYFLLMPRSGGFQRIAPAAARYAEYLQDAWLLLAVPRFSASFKRRVVSPPAFEC